MRALVVLPGRTPQWVVGHARDIAHRFADRGTVMVAFTHGDRTSTLPGECGRSSVLGHSLSGTPLWTGRLAVTSGVRARRDVTVIVLWNGANETVALWAAAVARLRGERVVLDVVDGATVSLTGRRRVVRQALCRLAHRSLERVDARGPSRRERLAVVVCGDDTELAHVAIAAADGMADDAVSGWRFHVHVEPSALVGAVDGLRRRDRVQLCDAPPGTAEVHRADVVVAAMGTPGAQVVRTAVLSGGAGVLVGPAIAARVPRSHDGVWLAKRDTASLLVALEASTGTTEAPPVPVEVLRDWGSEVIAAALVRTPPAPPESGHREVAA